MPKKTFISLFAGNESNSDWIDTALSSGKPYAERLKNYEEDLRRSTLKLRILEQETGLSIERIKDISTSPERQRTTQCNSITGIIVGLIAAACQKPASIFC